MQTGLLCVFGLALYQCGETSLWEEVFVHIQASNKATSTAERGGRNSSLLHATRLAARGAMHSDALPPLDGPSSSIFAHPTIVKGS